MINTFCLILLFITLISSLSPDGESNMGLPHRDAVIHEINLKIPDFVLPDDDLECEICISVVEKIKLVGYQEFKKQDLRDQLCEGSGHFQFCQILSNVLHHRIREDTLIHSTCRYYGYCDPAKEKHKMMLEDVEERFYGKEDL